MTEEKKNKVVSILKNIILAICIIFLLFIIIICIVGAIEKDVDALSSNDSFFTDNVSYSSVSDNDYILYYFSAFDSRLIYGDSYPIVVIDNYSTFYVAFTYYGSYITLGSNAFSSVSVSKTSDIQGVLVSFYNGGSSLAVDVVVYSYDNSVANNYSTNLLGTYILSNASYDVELYSKIWQNGLFYDSNDYIESYSEIIYNTLSTNYIFQTTEYQNDHLFGNLVSSFLNIQFGRITIGSTTYNFTLGLLFLFILGLGALFIIIKVFLGG